MPSATCSSKQEYNDTQEKQLIDTGLIYCSGSEWSNLETWASVFHYAILMHKNIHMFSGWNDSNLFCGGLDTKLQTA